MPCLAANCGRWFGRVWGGQSYSSATGHADGRAADPVLPVAPGCRRAHHFLILNQDSFEEPDDFLPEGLVLDAGPCTAAAGVRNMLTPPHAPGGHRLRRGLAGRAPAKTTGLEGVPGVLSSVMHRDDICQRRLAVRRANGAAR